MALKENRKVALSKKDKLSGKYINIKEAVPEGCVRSVYVEQLDFPILIAKQSLQRRRWSYRHTLSGQ